MISDDDTQCRVYWGHCGCDLYRGHMRDGLPHVGLHFNEAGTETTAVHVMSPDTPGYEHIFGEDAEQ